MKKIWLYLSSLLCMLLAFTGCDAQTAEVLNTVIEQQLEAEYQEESYYEEDILSEDDAAQESVSEDEEQNDEAADSDEVQNDEVTDAQDANASEDDQEEVVIDENGHYTSCDEVALYLHTYGELPDNFITKKEAQALGWDSKKGNLHEVAPGMSIGGDRFGNYEQILPDNDYKECDINYSGGYRGDERIVFSDDGDIYYTDDHYASFIQLY